MMHIVLVNPEIPQNTGNIARTCAATGAKLHLIEPLGFELSDQYLKRAGLDYWHTLDISYFDSLEELRALYPDARFFYASTHAKNRYTDTAFQDGDFLVFGKETAGLPEWLLAQNEEQCVRLPMIDNDAARSLNLSNAVAVGVFEALRQLGYPRMRTEGHLTGRDETVPDGFVE